MDDDVVGATNSVANQFEESSVHDLFCGELKALARRLVG